MHRLLAAVSHGTGCWHARSRDVRIGTASLQAEALRTDANGKVFMQYKNPKAFPRST